MERPIIFSGEMVRAILEGRKTQTRRVIKPHPIDSRTDSATHDHALLNWFWADEFGLLGEAFKCPFGVPGDRLWVRETFVLTNHQQPVYRADFKDKRGDLWTSIADDPTDVKWRSSLYMPRRYSRLTLEITGIRVERLQVISEEDAKAEGVAKTCGHPDLGALLGVGCSHVEGFAQLWRMIHGIDNPKAWGSNPWVWVIEFKRTDTEVSDE